MTKFRTASATALALLVATTLGAQAQNAAAPATQPAAAAADRVTVTGCIERADQFSSAGSVGTTVDSQDFVLFKAAEGAAASSASAAPAAGEPRPTGTSGTAIGPIYRLQADIDKLNPHVGHKVEIVGTPDAPAASAPGASAANSSAGSAPRLHVESVKMLAATCGR
jgi:hypothetical protein